MKIVTHSKPQESAKRSGLQGPFPAEPKPGHKLDVVLKADSMGTLEAIVSAVELLELPGVEIEAHAGIGHISKSDLFLAGTGSRLVVGFNVDLLPKVNAMAKERQIEVRLYHVIPNLIEGLRNVARSLIMPEEKERVTGRAKVIALFPGGRDAVILGCEVLEGALALGQDFRVISAPGVVHTGRIDSLHIEKNPVTQAGVGRQVGLRIPGFKRGRVGDLVETFEKGPPASSTRWRATAGVFRY